MMTQEAVSAKSRELNLCAERERKKIEYVPLDVRLALPESKFSYWLKDWD